MAYKKPISQTNIWNFSKNFLYKVKKPLSHWRETFFKFRIWQLLIFPGGYPPSIVSASSLYDRVRDGNGWNPAASPPENLALCLTYLKQVQGVRTLESCIQINFEPIYLRMKHLKLIKFP